MVLCAMLCAIFIGCDKDNKKEAENKQNADNTSQSDESVEPEDGLPYKVAPYATVDFIQDWKCAKWCDVEWSSLLSKLQKCGIEQIILQCTYNVAEDGGITQVFDDGGHEDCCGLEYLLQEAEKRGIKVWVGSAYTHEWDQNKFVNPDWQDAQIEVNKKNFKIMYDKFKKQYPNAFYGWYYSYEMWTNKVYYARWAEMLSKFINMCNDIDPSMPVSLSPYIQQGSGMTPEEIGTAWQHFMDRTCFREGDVVCPQMSWTGNDIPLDTCYKINDEIEKAVKSKAGVHYWLNIESFSDKGKAADYGQWEQVLRHGAKRCERIASFSITHTQLDTGKSGANGYKDYKAYVDKIKSEFEGKTLN